MRFALILRHTDQCPTASTEAVAPTPGARAGGAPSAQ